MSRAYSARHPAHSHERTQQESVFPLKSHTSATILVVDDEASIANLLAETLCNAGYHVLRASNGHTALAIARSEHPALILSDRNMPEVDGIEFVRLLHANPRTRQIPVVLMSSLPLNTDTAGTVAFLAKPFDLDDMLATVATYAPIA